MDSRLRELERWARDEGTLEAQVELLRARLREGDISIQWLAVAGHLGQRAARNVLGRLVPVATYETLLRSLQADAWTREACMRAAACWVEPEATGRLERAAHEVLAFCEAREEDERARLHASLAAQRAGARDPIATVLETALSPSEAGAQSALRTLLPPLRPGHAARPGDALRLREALQPWALAGRGEPPAGLLPPDPAAWEGFGVAPAPARAQWSAFQGELRSAEVAEEARALGARVRAKTLSQERVRLAALFGHPGAWKQCAPPGEPELEAPQNSTAMAGSLIAALARLATRGLPRDPQRLADLLARVRAEPRELPRGIVFPPWWRAFVAQLALAAGGLALEARPAPEASWAALAAGQAFLAAPAGDPSPLRLAVEGAVAASLRLGGPERAAARAAAWAARLCLLALTSAQRPSFAPRGQDVLEETLAAGASADALWARLRAEAVEFALSEGSSPSLSSETLRAYRPEDHYLEGERLRHPSFGEGRVLARRGDRIDVGFADETRTLIHREVV